MRVRRGWFIYSLGAIIICLALLGALFLYISYAASQALPTNPLVVISGTIPENLGVSGQPLVVFAEASDPDGIANVELWINGQQVATQSNPEASSLLTFNTSQAWIPNGAGNYLAVMKAIDRGGFTGESNPYPIQVQDRSFGLDPQIQGEYIVQEGDTLESIASRFGTTPDHLRELNPGLDDLIPGEGIIVPPIPEEESGGDSGGVPPAGGEGSAPRVDPPPIPVDPGDAAEAEPMAEEWWRRLPLPEGFYCLVSPALCGTTIEGEPPPFPAPSGVGFTAGADCSFDVFWTDNSDNELGFKIYRIASRPRFRFDLLELVGPAAGSGTVLSYTDAHPPLGSFSYVVVAFNSGGNTWSALSPETELEACIPSDLTGDQALIVEGLEMSVADTFERLYCYASLADSPFERIPHGAASFIDFEAGSWNIAEHFSGENKREVLVDGAGPLNITVECLGWQGHALVNLGRFNRSHPPTDWLGSPLTAGPDAGGYQVTYRINYSFRAADEGGRASWPLIDARLPAPFNLHTVEDTSDCRLPPDRREPGDPCQRTLLEWDYTPLAELPRMPTAYKIYKRTRGDSVPILYHTTSSSRRTAPLFTSECNATVNYSVSAVLGNDPVTGEDIQSPLSEEFVVPATCGSLEVTLDFLWNYNVNDGDTCTIFVDCTTFDYEAYGWLEFNGRRIRWNDHCDPGLFGSCLYVGPSYTEVPVASEHRWADLNLNHGEGWGRGQNVIRVPIVDGTALTMVYTLMDHDEWTEDTRFCGGTGRSILLAAGRTVAEWQAFDQNLEHDDGNCIIGVRVRGLP